MIEWCNALRRYPLFALPPQGWLEAWVCSGKRHAVEAGQTLLSTGLAGTHIFLILAGKVRVLRPGSGGREITLGILGPGEVFGEYALLKPGLSTATCRGAEAGQVLQLPLAPLQEHLGELLAGRSRLKDWLRLHYVLAHLRNRPSLCFMSASSFLPLLDRMETLRFAAGNTIQADGLHDDRWFVIQTGQACVADEGDGHEMSERGPGDCFGERALLGQGAIPLVQAVSAVQCHVLRRMALDRPAEAAAVHSVQTALPAARVAAHCHEWVAQQTENDCGAAALAMATRAHGQRHTVEALRERMQIQQQGASLQELQRTAVELGFHAHAVRVALDHLAGVRLPAIAHLQDGHYVTLFELSAGNVVVGDPAKGVGRWSLLAFQQSWSGQLLLITPA